MDRYPELTAQQIQKDLGETWWIVVYEFTCQISGVDNEPVKHFSIPQIHFSEIYAKP